MSRKHAASAHAGQASVLLIALMLGILVGAALLGVVGSGIGGHGGAQRAADLSALAGARAMYGAYPRLFEGTGMHGRRGDVLDKREYLAVGRDAAMSVARQNGAERAEVGFPDGESFAPVRVRVTTHRTFSFGVGSVRRSIGLRAHAEAELAPVSADVLPASGVGGGYSGPLAYRQGKPMRPDVALAFDRLHAAARADGVALTITSAFRSDAEQAILFARRPDPRWVAPPGKSLHRNATELDLGPASAYGWLARHARRFGFLQRYSWEPWHYGYIRAAGTRSLGYGPPDGRSAMPAFVPPAIAPAISRAAQRWNVGAALLAAQLYAESNFNPYARSPAGAQGIAQFMPGTARAYGLRDPYDVGAAIDAQAHLMHDLLRQFSSVPLALAAYNAGPAPVQRCGCIPPYPETRGYVARILGLLGGAGDAASGGGLKVRLVR